jgi:hypothetical protein
VPLVGKQDVLDRHASLLERRHRLLGLDHGYVGVVRAVQHEQRRLDAVDLVNR